MKHKETIKTFLKESLNIQDEEGLKALGLSYQKLSDDLETGVKNGYTVEMQLWILKTILRSAAK